MGKLRAAWAVAALLILAISLAPFFIVEVPAVLDYPNHLARYFILAHPHDPNLAKMYAPQWRLVPNLGMDILGRALLVFLPPHVGGRILLALSLAAPLAGTVLYARAAFGRWTWWSLGSGVLAFNGIFILGFMNFLLSLGVALTGAAAWRIWRRRERLRLAALGGALIGLGAFFCHVLGFAYFALLIAADETEALYRLRQQGLFTWSRARSTMLVLAAALGPTLVLYALIHGVTARDAWMVWLWRSKLIGCLTPFMAYDWRMTELTAVVVCGVIILVWRRSRPAGGVVLALSLLCALFLMAPFFAAGAAFVDFRLALMAALLLFAGLAPRLTPRAGMAVGAALALVIAGRMAHVTANWQGRARDLADLRISLAHVEPGAKILPVRTDYPENPPQGAGRILPHVERLDEHLGALAVIERHAFWPRLFANPSQQPLRVKPPYDRIAAPEEPIISWQSLFVTTPTARDVGWYPGLTDWRAQFDYVLLLGPKPPPGNIPSGLTLIRAGEAASLYRIDHDQIDHDHRVGPV